MTLAVGQRTIAVGDRLYQPLVNLALFMSALAYAIEANRPGHRRLQEGDIHTAQSDRAELQIVFPAYGHLQDAIGNIAQKDLTITVRAANFVRGAFGMTEMPDYIGHMATPQFLMHFETCYDWLLANGRGDSSTWPPALDFARVVRNAVAHGGKLEIRNARTRTVSWGGLAYGPADDGRQIIGSDLYMADLVALMIAIDDEMVTLGAPR